MAEDAPADLEIAEAGSLPEQGTPTAPEANQTDKALDAVTKAFEEAEAGRNTEGQRPDRARDEAGRFAKQQADKAAADLAAKPAVDPAKPVETPVAPDGATPDGWKKGDRPAMWAAASPELRKAIADREAEVNAGFKMYDGLGPYVRVAQENGTTLATAVKDYWQLEQGLRTNFGEGIKAICQRMQVDPARLGAWLSGLPAPEGTTPQAPQAQPSLTADDVIRIVDQRSTAATRRTTVQDFFADTTNNPHADEVAGEMAVIIRAKIAADEPVDLKQVYQQALRLNPTHADRLLKEERAKWEQERLDKETAATQKARRLGASVKPSAGPTQRPNGKMTPEQAAAAAFDAIS